MQQEPNVRHKRSRSNIAAASLGTRKTGGSFPCPYPNCGKSFSESGNLKTHLRTHTGERPFVCETCGKAFVTKGHLKSHNLTHTGEKPNVCEICGKRYSRIGRLRIHERTHTGEKPFVCSTCGKAFTEKGNLNTHTRIHTGEKPYECSHPGCGKKFTTLGHLKDHSRRHTNERPYLCTECGASFLRSNTLKIHRRRHTGEKPYTCSYQGCGKAFAESGNLKTHMKTHHEQQAGIDSVVPAAGPSSSIVRIPLLPKYEEEDKVLKIESEPLQHLNNAPAPPNANSIFLPLAAIRPQSEEPAVQQILPPPAGHLCFSTSASPLMNPAAFIQQNSPKACQPTMQAYVSQPQPQPYTGTPKVMGNTPGMLSRGSPSAFSPCIGAVSDFASMYFRTMMSFAPHASEGQLPQSPGCYRAAADMGLSPTEQVHGFNLPKQLLYGLYHNDNNNILAT